MSVLSLNLSDNYSIYAIPLAWVVAITPHIYAVGLYNINRAPGTPKWDVREPKITLLNVKEAKLSPTDQGKFIRAEAAQMNGFQNLAFFATAIIAANIAKLPLILINKSAILCLISTIAYNYLYISSTTALRTWPYLFGIGVIFNLFIRAGNELR